MMIAQWIALFLEKGDGGVSQVFECLGNNPQDVTEELEDCVVVEQFTLLAYKARPEDLVLIGRTPVMTIWFIVLQTPSGPFHHPREPSSSTYLEQLLLLAIFGVKQKSPTLYCLT